MSVEETLVVIKEFGLKVRELEPDAYLVLTAKEVDVESLKFRLQECALVTAMKCRWIRAESGYDVSLTRVYYILLKSNDYALQQKYVEYARVIDEDAFAQPYKYKSSRGEFDLPIYGVDEI